MSLMMKTGVPPSIPPRGREEADWRAPGGHGYVCRHQGLHRLGRTDRHRCDSPTPRSDTSPSRWRRGWRAGTTSRSRRAAPPSPWSWPAWPASPKRSAAAAGWAIRANRSATWSTSESAAPIWGPSWPTRRCATTRTAPSPSASSPTWTPRTSPKRLGTCGPRKPCSSWPRRPSPRRRP